LTVADRPRHAWGVIVNRRRSVVARGGLALAVLLGLLVLVAGCAPPVVTAGASPEDSGRPRAFSFAEDTFAFPNEIRARHPGAEHLYANYCFVLARGIRQFFAFARFDPAAPRLDHAGYVERVRRVVARPPWAPPLPDPERVVIPGYPNVRELSRAEEAAVKEGLGGRFWTLVHWTNWRVVLPVSAAHQAKVAREVVAELDAGRLVQLLVTNWPVPELNHTVVAFQYRRRGEDIDLIAWDPNDPATADVITFEAGPGRFYATRVYDTRPGVIRVFRMTYSALL
jgi:hypothetical protein